MVDLHTHILPGIDDGPKSFDESVELIRMEAGCGAGTVAMTPHFELGSGLIEAFCKSRSKAAEELRKRLSALNIDIKIIEGAEVKLSPKPLADQEKEKLCFEATSFMLVELPAEYYLCWVPDAIYELRLRGITPVIAHVERYQYIFKKPQILYDLVNSGCLAQINADSLVSGTRKSRKFALKLIKSGAIQIIASDAHSVKHRPPMIGEAMKIIEKKIGREFAENLRKSSEAIAADSRPELILL